MGLGLGTQITALWQKYLDVGTHFTFCSGYLYSAGEQLAVHNYANAGYFLKKAALEIDYAADDTYSATDSVLKWSIYLHDWYNDNVGDGIDMDTILEAMITADFLQIEKFIGRVDAYRIALWNEPFNIAFYAALGRWFRP